MKLNEDFLAQMREATQLLQSGGPAAATAAIQRALQGIPSDVTAADAGNEGLIDINPAPRKTSKANKAGNSASKAQAASTNADEAVAGMPGGEATQAFLDQMRQASAAAWANAKVRLRKNGGAPSPTPEEASGHEAPGKFIDASCTNRAGTRAYKLYIPSGYSGEALPLIVMLHGCKQHPEDFAHGTGMNHVAEKNNCFVVYPAPAQRANGSNCWNWFNAADQRRDAGEPSIIADITREIMRDYKIDADRVYVAGLSAGAAMATIVTAAYPDLYAAVGIHSGLPVGSAHDVASAFGVMKDGSKAASPRAYKTAVPAIVFHGDRDHTVHPDNGTSALKQAMAASSSAGHDAEIVKAKSPQGRSYTRTVYTGNGGAPVAEHWVVHGAGHAWSGGSKRGSYTDPKGPDASSEMVRFFYAHPKRSANPQ